MVDAVIEAGWECFQEESPPGADAVVDVLDASASTFSDSCLQECVPGSVEELLDEGERFLQEFRWSSAALLNCVCQPDAVRILVEHVVREPGEDLPLERTRRRCHTAAELLASCALEGGPLEDGTENGSTRLIQIFFANSDSELLDLLWSFLFDDVPADLEKASWNVLAGYFCSSAAALFSRRPEELVEYLRGRGPDLLLEQFLRCLSPRCMAELFTSLLCAEVPQKVIVPIDGLLFRLVECLGNDALPGCDAENIALSINTLLSQACGYRLCYAGAVLEQISSPDIAERLVQQVVGSQNMDAAVAAASILSCAVACLQQFPPHPLLMHPAPDFLRPSPDEEANVGISHEQEQDLQTASSRLIQALSPHLPQLCDFLFSLEAPPLEIADCSGELATLRHAILLALHACKDGSVADSDLVNQLLELSPQSRSLEAILVQNYIGEGVESDATVQIPSKEQLLSDLRQARAHFHGHTYLGGSHANVSPCRVTVEVFALLVQLARTREPLVYQHFLETALLQRSIALLLRSNLCSALQNTVVALFSEVARSCTELATESVVALLRDGETMSNVFEALRRSPSIQQALEQSSEIEACRDDMIRHSPQPNFNGQLRAICVELHHLGDRVQEVQQGLHCLDGWTELVVPELEAAERLEQQPLGGLPQTMSTEYNTDAEGQHVDFSAEDLRDIDEDFDTEVLLNLAGRPYSGEQQLHRQAQVQEALQKMGGSISSASIGIAPPDTEEC
eukprot:TRINITY_DN25300_c0_g1_i1.p1 TRINITY_DN25300_c0_g1~~TRINITY_DN25300_c0_g1_i1.p1  ORF type:complete len:740 (-),score=136.24 TRINITY_DN25300_c0_g1_i1:22-2241(-)